jgi:hypothetical protein
MKLSLCFAALLALAGCNLDHTSVSIVTTGKPVVHGTDPNAIAIAEGAAYGIKPVIVHEEIEGSSGHPVDDARPDDPTIVRVAHDQREYDVDINVTERGFVIMGLARGTTTLRFYRGGDEVGSTLVQVVAQDP